MAKQNINIGVNPGDGTGDVVREAFSKSKDNFDELYARPVADMNKSQYDTDNSGVVDAAEKVSGIDASGALTYYGKNAAGAVGFHIFSDDKVAAFVDFASFPIAGFEGVIYIDQTDFSLYLWDDVNNVYFEAGVTHAYVDSKIEDAIVDGVLDKAPSQNVVFDKLALKVDKVTGKSLISDTEITRLAGVKPGATPIVKPFTYAGGVQEFTVDTPIIKPDYILVGNTSLQLTQFTWAGSKFTITDTLTVGAAIEIGYWDDTTFINSIAPDGVIESGNLEAVSGGEIYSHVLSKTYRENLFINNRFLYAIENLTTFTKTGFIWTAANSVTSYNTIDSLGLFSYIGKCTKFKFNSLVDNGGLVISKSDFVSKSSYDNTIAANIEINSPVSLTGTLRVYQVAGGVQVKKGSDIPFTFGVGVNTISFPQTSFDTSFDYVWFRFFPNLNAWDNQTIYWGRTFVYSGGNATLRLDDNDSHSADAIKAESKKLNLDLFKENLFIHNKYLEDLNSAVITGIPINTSFNFGSAILSQNFIDAFPIFGYVGNCASFQFTNLSNGGLLIKKSEFENLSSYNGSLTANLEVYSPVAVTGTIQFNQGTSGSFVAKGDSIPFTFGVGVNIFAFPLTPFDASSDFVWLRIFPDASWDNQTVKFGRVMLSSETINKNELEVSIKEIYQNLYDSSELIKGLITDLTPFSLSHWYGKKMIVLGDSITYQTTWQPEITRAIGVVNTNLGVGGSMVTPYITGTIGKNATESIYYRADSVDTYTPDLILLFGGQNDNLVSMGGQIPLGTINDTPYIGVEVSSNPPSFYSSYMGTVEKLLTQNKSASLILITPLWSANQTYAIKKTKTDAIKEIGALYGVRVINLLEESGINSINSIAYLQDGVHPNNSGGLLIGALISNYLR